MIGRNCCFLTDAVLCYALVEQLTLLLVYLLTHIKVRPCVTAIARTSTAVTLEGSTAFEEEHIC